MIVRLYLFVLIVLWIVIYLTFMIYYNVDWFICWKSFSKSIILTYCILQIFGSILGVSAGFVVGKEGPMVHTGACIANLLGQGGSRKYHLTWKWLRYFKNDRDRRDLITCGAAAGVAAAFRAPVGGVLFALEEIASWSLSLSLTYTHKITQSFTRIIKMLNTCLHSYRKDCIS